MGQTVSILLLQAGGLQFSGTELHPDGFGSGLLSVILQDDNPVVLHMRVEHSVWFMVVGSASRLMATTFTELEQATGPTVGTPVELTVTCPVFNPAVE